MITADQARPQKGRRLKSILSFASTLEARLPTAATSKNPALLAELEEHISALPGEFHARVASKYEELDRVGTVIWNLCTRLRRDFDSDDPQEVPLILLLARVYAFLLLNGAHESGKGTDGNLARLMKIGIKAAKSCLERKNWTYAHRVLSKVSAYEVTVKRPGAELSLDDKETCERLLPEYFVLRTALSWHSNDLKMADVMFEKSTSSWELFSPSTVESLADTLYEIGRDLLSKQEFSQAETWLNRAHELLNGPELDRLSMDANELRVSIIQSLIKTHMALEPDKHMDKARNMLALLENELGDKLVVLLLKLEMLSHSEDEVFDANSYSDILQRMTRTVPLNSNNFKLMMFHIRQLSNKSPSLACKVLDGFLSLRILNNEQDLPAEWVEKALVTRLYLTSMQRESLDIFTSLDNIFSVVIAGVAKPVSSGATLAAHTLIWKNIESNYTQGQYEMAGKWCRLASHSIFESSGEHNMAIISRKMLLCALARTDIGSAREVFNSMSEVARNEPMTRFLMYKIALRCQEPELASECLRIISNSTDKEPTLLFACCLDAQQAGNKYQTLAALQLVLEKYGHGTPTIHLPSLLRLTIGLMHSVIDTAPASDYVEVQQPEGSSDGEVTVEKLCKLFELAVASLRNSHRSVRTPGFVWTIDELNWFSKNSYNTAIKHLKTWRPAFSLRILKCCTAFINAFPDDIGEQMFRDLCLRKMFCEFSAATALVAMARGEDDIKAQLQYYLDLHKHVDSYDALLQDKLLTMDQDAEEDLHRKLSILLAFDFEASCRLKEWPRLGGIILKAESCGNCQVFEIMADCVLCAEPPANDLITTLKKIINAAWGLPSFNYVSLAKYMRCLFQIAIPSNPIIAEQLIDQVQSHVEEAVEKDVPYPSEELEWIVTRAFNHAVELYCQSDDNGCQKWAAKAINIAHYCADKGTLKNVLQNKLMSLQFGGT